MDIEKGELRIVKGRRKNFVILKIGIAVLTIVVGLILDVVIWKPLYKDSGLITPRALSLPPLAENGGNTTWYGFIIVCVQLLLYPLLMLGPRNMKLVGQVIFETIRNIYRNINPQRQALSFVFTVFSILVISLILLGTSDIALSIIPYPLRLRSSEDPAIYLPNERFKIYNHAGSPQLIIANVTRYNTEDVLMRCQFSVPLKSDEIASTIMQSLYWTKDNGSRVTETDKIHINTIFQNYSRDNATLEFLIESVLTIEVIDDGDYGTYSCEYSANLNQLATEDEPSSINMDGDHPSVDRYKIPEIELGVMKVMNLTEVARWIFHLEKEKMPVKTARVSPGGVFIDHVPYWSLADPGDITFNTTISGKDNADCCWLPARLYKSFFGYEHLVWRRKTEDQHQRHLIRQQCVCVEDFVLKNSTVAFMRTRYNSTTKHQERFEVGHPRQVILIPDLPCVFRLHPFMTESLWLRDDYQNCAITNDSSAVCRERFQFINRLFTTIMSLDLFNWVFSFTETIVILVMCWFVTRGWIRHVLLPVQKIILDPPPMADDYIYDLYLMYDEEDRYETKVAKTLRKLVEGPTFFVFDPWRDILPGHLVPTEQERAIVQSRTFCVGFSNSTENDDEQQFELVSIKKTLAARTSSKTDYSDSIFTIQIGDCKVDSFLSSSVKATVPVNDREANELDQDVLHTFSEWTLASKASWIKMKRGGVVGAQQRFQPLVKPIEKYVYFVACHLFMYLYFLWVSALDWPYENINKMRHVYYEAE